MGHQNGRLLLCGYVLQHRHFHWAFLPFEAQGYPGGIRTVLLQKQRRHSGNGYYPEPLRERGNGSAYDHCQRASLQCDGSCGAFLSEAGKPWDEPADGYEDPERNCCQPDHSGNCDRACVVNASPAPSNHSLQYSKQSGKNSDASWSYGNGRCPSFWKSIFTAEGDHCMYFLEAGWILRHLPSYCHPSWVHP